VFETFTERARESIVCAQDEARDMGLGAVQVEHLLLGLFSDHDGVAGQVFADFGLTIAPVRDLVRERLGVRSSLSPEVQLRFSSEAEGVLKSPYRFGLGEPGTEHMLLVIVSRPEGGACEILRALGADPNRVRIATKKRSWPVEAGPRPRLVMRVRSIRDLDFGD
jgi:ATP-dependent Clp protease ATP-binding subunit ClpA